ncbi:MAG TPA: nitrilase [Sulfurimonas sp. UBA12504]|nr:MAG: nitrilase [Sulfurimonas sp. GWF2_37_8]DAB30161.1 MAG TPA: nitrilase [Sulfurimonas sp. UBA12504]
MNVTLVQSSPKLNRSNLATTLAIVELYKNNSDLIVFPELSLNGYLLQDKLFEDAWDIDELNALKEVSKEVDIVVGAAIREGVAFRNAALYFSKGNLLSQHNKVHLPNYGMFEEARYFDAGNIFESFQTQNMKISMLVCEDLWHESVHKDLVKENPDLIIVLVASPARGFGDDGLYIQKQWYSIIQTVAKECCAKLLFVNRVGFEDGLGFWGGSCILDEEANILHKIANFKEYIETFKIEDKI